MGICYALYKHYQLMKIAAVYKKVLFTGISFQCCHCVAVGSNALGFPKKELSCRYSLQRLYTKSTGIKCIDASFEKQSDYEWKNLKLYCKFLHAFVVLEQGFGMNEEDIENFFYDGRLRINKERVGKRSAKVKAGDVIDLIKLVSDEDVTMRRIEIMAAKKCVGKWEVDVKRWKHLVVKRIIVPKS